MARRTGIHLPEDEYLLAIGQFAYMVTNVEALLIFDTPGLAAYLPASLTPASLAHKTTKQIGRALEEAASDISDTEVRDYFEFGAQVLLAAGDARNHLLHSRPATDPDNRTRLNRWTASLGFWITDDWIAEQIDLLSKSSDDLNRLRPLHKHTEFGGGPTPPPS